MYTSFKLQDRMLAIFLVVLVVGIPVLISAYENQVWDRKVEPDAKIFMLTGHIDRGWVDGDIKAFEVGSRFGGDEVVEHPVIRVKKGDKVVIKLTSSDVIHGFSLKDFGVYVEEGIVPGKITLVSFVADKKGKFQFTCNAICGSNHEKMIGTLIVQA